MEDFKKLKVWSKAHDLTLEIYRKTCNFPKNELYGITGQIRRAAASIPANIAEGCGRRSDAELGRFLQIARGSASELEYYLLLAHDLQFLQRSDFDPLNERVIEIERMLTCLAQTVHSARQRAMARG
jgi:four helix bundle protein